MIFQRTKVMNCLRIELRQRGNDDVTEWETKKPNLVKQAWSIRELSTRRNQVIQENYDFYRWSALNALRFSIGQLAAAKRTASCLNSTVHKVAGKVKRWLFVCIVLPVILSLWPNAWFTTKAISTRANSCNDFPAIGDEKAALIDKVLPHIMLTKRLAKHPVRISSNSQISTIWSCSV